MDKEILTTITFQENCEYKTSTVSKIVPIPKQEVTIQLESPINMEDNRNGVFYYNDKIKLEATVFQNYGDNQKNFIQTGRINFYFQPTGEEPKLINKPINDENTCELNKNGSAAVYFKPTSSGKVWAEYIDDNDFYISNSLSDAHDIILQEIPINIDFHISPPYLVTPYLADVHDEVNIKVHVTNSLDDSDIQFGTVTFFHYLVKYDDNDPNKRVPDVIGNPVPVLNGYAEINYIPVQTDDDTESEILIENNEERYVEYIRAVYNYTGKYIDTDKGDFKWQYFGTGYKWTGINVLARNSITINPPLSLSLDGENGIYQCTPEDTITVTAILKDKNNKQINFKNHNGKLIFHIKGAHPHPNEDVDFLEYDKDIEATFDSENNQFTADISNLLPGYYTVTATTEVQTDEGEILIDYAGTDNDVTNSKKYAPINESNIIYLSSNYVKVTPTITLSHDTYFNETNSTLNNLIGEVTNIPNTQKSILNNKTCYFYVPKINKQYIGTLSYDSTSKKLTGTPIDDIKFNIADNYRVFMYIPAGVYTNKTNVTTYHTPTSAKDFYLDYNYSNPVSIEVRDIIHLSLSINPLRCSLPASFSYNCVSEGLTTQASVQLISRPITQSTVNVIAGMVLFKEAPSQNGTIEFDTPGEYEIYAKSNDAESNKVYITVDKDTLVQRLDKVNMFASVDNTICVYLSCIEGNIQSIVNDKIKAYIYDHNKANEKEATIQNFEIINEKNKQPTLYLTIKPEIWNENDWYVKITYEGDDKIAPYNGKMEKFTSKLCEPSIKLIPHTYNYNVEITSSHSNNNNIIICEIIFYNKNNEVGRGIFISNEEGKGSIINDNISWWDDWTNVVFNFKPYDTTLKNIINNNKNSPYNKLASTYGKVFDSNDVAHSKKLYDQLSSHNQYIFNTYKTTNVKVARPRLY